MTMNVWASLLRHNVRRVFGVLVTTSGNYPRTVTTLWLMTSLW